MQLDGVLRSFFLHCKDPNNIAMNILYHASNEKYKNQYKQLTEDYSKRNVKFIEEIHFRHDFLKLLNYFIRPWQLLLLCLSIIANVPIFKFIRKLLFKLKQREFVMFLVDDNIFVKSFEIKSIVDILSRNDDCIGFSLRLGTNINYCYPKARIQAPPYFIEIGDDVMKYDWTTSEDDFAYPLEISSSIYRIQDVLPFLKHSKFKNPNTLESSFSGKKRFFTRIKPLLLCFRKSVTFCNPVNIVQETTKNRVGLKKAYLANNLSQMFKDGYRIDVEKFTKFTPNSCHQEVDLALKPIS